MIHHDSIVGIYGIALTLKGRTYFLKSLVLISYFTVFLIFRIHNLGNNYLVHNRQVNITLT